MRIYAAISDSGTYYRVLREERYPHILASFAYDEQRRVLQRLQYQPDSLVSDSGAFSAWQSGATIDLDAYVGWCRHYRNASPSLPLWHVNLDVVAGTKGKPVTAQQRLDAIARGMANADAMRAAGVRVAEVYHQYEPTEVFDQLLDRRQDGEVVCVATLKSSPKKARGAFLERCWYQLTRRYGRTGPFPPVHGLGISHREWIFRYPWWSVDTLQWAAPGMFGEDLDREGTPRLVKGRGGAKLYAPRCAGVLRHYRRWMDQTERLWAQRGVTWLEPDLLTPYATP